MANRSLEIRVNSIADAKSVMQNHIAINQKAKNLGVTIECLVASEIYPEVQAQLAGAFHVKAFYSQVTPRVGNILHILPHYVEPTEVEIKTEPVAVKRKPALDRPVA